MPELPEVETMVRGVRPHLQGRTIVRTRLCRCTRKPITLQPKPRQLQQRLRNRPILDVHRLAKRIVITLDHADALVIEPRMTGLLLVSEPPTQDHRRLLWELNPTNDRAASFEFWDRRGLGTVSLLNQQQLQDITRRLGPDPLTMTSQQWQEPLSRTRRAVKVALLDPALVAGIGNIYASEILHRAGISPETPAASLSRRAIRRLADASQQILQDAIRYEGSTLGDGTYRNALNRDGSYQNQHRVYQKHGQRCTSCDRAEIRRIVQAQRATFYCPACQQG